MSIFEDSREILSQTSLFGATTKCAEGRDSTGAAAAVDPDADEDFLD
jgi:hypothetical protein